MPRLALPAIRLAVQALLTGDTDLMLACPGKVRGAPGSDVESDADQGGGGDAVYPYITVAVASGAIESGLRGSATRADHTLRVLVWGRRGQPGEYKKLADACDLLCGLLDGWQHSETDLRWTVARGEELEVFQPTDGGPGLDALGANWVVTVKYC